MQHTFHSSTRPIYEYTDTTKRIIAYGHGFTYDPDDPEPRNAFDHIWKRAKPHLSQNVTYDRLHWQRFPDGRTLEGRRDVCVIERTRLFPSPWADGVILTAVGTAVAAGTRDCPMLVLYWDDGGPMAVLHCGRHCLHNDPDLDDTVIAHGLKLLREYRNDICNLRGFITLGIAPEHFAHDDEQAETHRIVIDALANKWGAAIVNREAGYTLDLRALIRAQLAKFGAINPERVRNDCFDTYADGRLASYRKGDSAYNLLVVEHTY